MNSSDIRQAFFEYFIQKGHTKVASSSLVPEGDATLLFTNAGMVQFKDTFLGVAPRHYTRAVSAQRCVRAGGKHNDLDNVGYTARHHTFFEMLGNFSFGDYFKKEAIAFAWEFLTKILKLPEARLWITVYQDDDEATDIWLNQIGVSPLRFSRCGEKDNFWSMGDTGPCGPCSEIFYDHGPDIAGGPPGSLDADGDRYIEIWNLVFMQYNRDQNGVLHPLPKPSVDTGMGLERIAAVVQGVHNNYQIDTFTHIIDGLAQSIDGVDKNNASLRVIADHLRACAFLIADGVLPSNEGRGYVLRRIIRRAIRHGYKIGAVSPFFGSLVDLLIATMGGAYPELLLHKNTIEQTLNKEEQQFAKTLDVGMRLLHENIKNLTTKEIPGDLAFQLYDTYGFPLDLTADFAREQGLVVDEAGFEQCMAKQRQQSLSTHSFHADKLTPIIGHHATEFKGYEHEQHQGSIQAMVCDGASVTQMTAGHNGAVVLSVTPFYAESGGQVGDTGMIFSATGHFRVDDTKYQGNVIVHYGHMLEGIFSLEDEVCAEVHHDRRGDIRRNHSATHLLHAALKTELGAHVMQKGSLVEDTRARFDFSHSEGLSLVEIETIERLVNQQIIANHPALTDVMSMSEAEQSGAMALFGEKYGESVRVLTLGGFSKELCGGTHVVRTGDIGLFKITAEYGVASGVRRIEFVTGLHALAWVHEQEHFVHQISQALKTSPTKALDKLVNTLQSIKQYEKERQQLKQQSAAQLGQRLVTEVQETHGIRWLIHQTDVLDAQGIRALLDELKSKIPESVLILISVMDDKMHVIASVAKSLLTRVPSAVNLVQRLCGKGGGRDDLAQGGSGVPDDLAVKLKDIKKLF